MHVSLPHFRALLDGQCFKGASVSPQIAQVSA